MRFLSLFEIRRLPRRRRSRRARRAPRYADRFARRRLTAGALIAASVAGTAWLWQDGWFARRTAATAQAALAATARAGLALGDVLVEGRQRTERGALMAALGVGRGVPILGFDPHAAKRRLEALPWVRAATVERRLPDAIYVRLVERQPLALWQDHGRVAVIDHAGAVIPGARAAGFAHLPLVVGEDAPAHAAGLIAMLAREPELKARVAAAVRVRGRRWNVRLDSGIDVRLPEDGPAAAWAQLARIEREHGLLQRDVVTIDLRTPDRLVVRTAPGATLKVRDGEET